MGSINASVTICAEALCDAVYRCAGSNGRSRAVPKLKGSCFDVELSRLILGSIYHWRRSFSILCSAARMHEKEVDMMIDLCPIPSYVHVTDNCNAPTITGHRGHASISSPPSSRAPLQAASRRNCWSDNLANSGRSASPTHQALYPDR